MAKKRIESATTSIANNCIEFFSKDRRIAGVSIVDEIKERDEEIFDEVVRKLRNKGFKIHS